MGNYQTAFGLLIILAFVLFMFGMFTNVSSININDNIERIDMSIECSEYVPSKPTGGFFGIADFIGALSDLFINPCTKIPDWLMGIIFIPIAIILGLLAISHIPFFGRGG